MQVTMRLRESRLGGGWRRWIGVICSGIIVGATIVNLIGSMIPLLTGRIALSTKRAHSARNLQVSKGSLEETRCTMDSLSENDNTATSTKSRIPTVLLAGTQKASTTSLAVYLMDQNQTCFSDEDQPESHSYGKESHFFDSTKYEVGVKYYEFLYRKCPKDAILIEGTPNTMMFPERVKQIYDEHGSTDQLKIIFILREPVSREISWYDHQVRYSSQAIRPWWTKDVYDEDGNIRSFIDVQRETVIKHFEKEKYESLTGYFAHWLKKWSALFDRKTQILILSYDELVSDPSRMLQRVHEFLNIPVQGRLSLPRENSFKKKTPRPPCSDQMELFDYFKSANNELYKYLEENPGPSMEQRPFPKFKLKCRPRIPSVLLAGAPMSGSNSIAENLWFQKTMCFSKQHNSEESVEGPHFFDAPGRYKHGLAKYQKMYKSCDENRVLVDATPGSMVFPEKVKAIYDEQGTSDDLQIIFILREPVSRQVTAYNYQKQMFLQGESSGWGQALLNADGQVRSFIDMQRETVIRDFETSEGRFSYGNYVRWIRLWCSMFSRKQILVLSYDELVQDPASLLKRMHRFLGRKSYDPHFVLFNETDNGEYVEPPCSEQLELAHVFEDPNEELYKFLEENPGSEWEQRPFPRFQLSCRFDESSTVSHSQSSTIG